MTGAHWLELALQTQDGTALTAGGIGNRPQLRRARRRGCTSLARRLLSQHSGLGPSCGRQLMGEQDSSCGHLEIPRQQHSVRDANAQRVLRYWSRWRRLPAKREMGSCCSSSRRWSLSTAALWPRQDRQCQRVGDRRSLHPQRRGQHGGTGRGDVPLRNRACCSVIWHTRYALDRSVFGLDGARSFDRCTHGWNEVR